jgi:hypothetical protein
MTGLNKREQKYIATLQRRMGHLKKRIDETKDKKLGYDEQEHNALRWAVDEIVKLRKFAMHCICDPEKNIKCAYHSGCDY